MPTQVTADGIKIEVPAGVVVTSGQTAVDRRLGPVFVGGPVPLPSGDDLEPVLIEALRQQGMVQALPIAINATRAGATRSGPAGADVRLTVPLASDQGAVALIEQGDVYSWIWPQSPADVGGAVTRSNVAGNAVDFVIPIGATPPTDAHRSILTSPLLAPVRVLVFRFVARHVVGAAVRCQEAALVPGLIAIAGASPSEWRAGSDVAIAPPKDSARHRALLLIHGTFSSTAGGFGQLAATPWGSEFLAACLERYDVVLGYDHRTLSVDPRSNAADIVAALKALPWGGGVPIVDMIAHSRGGLVARSLLQDAAPGAGWEASFGKVILVGATNSGTELASPPNWRSFLDLHTNLALAACRALTFLPHAAPVAAVLKDAISLIGEFAKQIPAAGLDAALAPGLSAMVPGSDTIERLTRADPERPVGDSTYHVISSSFAPRLTGGDHQPKEFPLRLIQVLAEATASNLMGGIENDLVVDLPSMSGLRAGGIDLVHDAVHFGASPYIYHTNYMSRPEVVGAFTRWLGLARPAHVRQPESIRRGTAVAPVGIPTLPPRADVPAAVDTDIIAMSAGESPAAVISAIRSAAPSYVVLARRSGDEEFRYVFSPGELERVLSTQPAESASEALDLHEWSSDAVVSLGQASGKAAAERLAFARGLSPAGTRPARTIVIDDEDIVGVLPNEAEAVIGADIGSIASEAIIGADRVLLRRAMPSFRDAADHLAPAPLPMRPTRRGLELPYAEVQPGHEPLRCEILAEAPATVALGKTLSVRVTISLEEAIASLGASSRASVEIDPSRNISVEVWPKRGFAFADDEDPASMRPPTPGNPSLASFHLRATTPGRGELLILVIQAKVSIATLKLTPEVLDGATEAAPQAILQAGKTVEQVRGRQPRHVLTILEQVRQGGETVFRFVLDSPSIGKLSSYWSNPIKGDRDAFVEGLYARIESRWTGSTLQASEFEEELRDLGSTLWTELLPEKLRADLWEAREKLDSIFVRSEEPFIPWELLFATEPGRPRSAEGRFLAELGLVRWLFEAEAPPPTALKVAKGRARYAIPSYPTIPAINLRPLPEAAAEEQFLRDRFSATPVEPSVKPVSDLLAGPGGFDLLHFAGHGAAARATFEEARIMLAGEQTPQGYVPNYLSAERVSGRADFGKLRPIIVLNACQAGRSNWKLTGLGGFARAFLSRKAGLFIGTLWAVGDAPARAFTEAFYDAMIRGQAVAPAVRVARASAKAKGDATWLAYAVYAHPEATLELVGLAATDEAEASSAVGS